MRSGGNNFSYFSENRLTKLANLVQFKRMLMFCLEDCEEPGPAGPPLSTPLAYITVTTGRPPGPRPPRPPNPQTRV